MKSLLCLISALTAITVVSARAADIARYILPPGNFGGLPTSVNSLDQLPLYSGLSPLRDNITFFDQAIDVPDNRLGLPVKLCHRIPKLRERR